MVLRLGHSDTARINAVPGTAAAKGTQYFWLSRDCYDFFPPLTVRNVRGTKATYSCLVTMRYVDVGVEDPNCRVTFEAENNLDFRLGTGPLRYQRCVSNGDLALISRVGESQYEMRFARNGTALHGLLAPYAVNLIGNQGKRYGYMPNAVFKQLAHVEFGAFN